MNFWIHNTLRRRTIPIKIVAFAKNVSNQPTSRTKTITKQLNVRIDREFVERLKLYSIKTKKSQSWIVQEAIDSYLCNMKNKDGPS